MKKRINRPLSINKRGSGRHPLKQREIAMYLATEIKSGRLRPGTRLAAREELKTLFATTSTTIQRAVDQLVKEGMLETISRNGTFITRRPPCLNRIGIVFHSGQGEPGWRGIDEAVWVLAKKALKNEYGLELVFYENCEPKTRENIDRREHLIDDVELGRVAGLLFSVAPNFLEGTSALTDEHLVRVSLQGRDKKDRYPTLEFGGSEFLPRALDYLKEQGRRRIAVLCADAVLPEAARLMARYLPERSLMHVPEWVQAVPAHAPTTSENLMRLLLRGKKTDRPDALIIMDDNLVPGILSGISATDCTPGRELCIIAHCNFTSAEVPDNGTLRLGYDIREALTAGLRLLRAQMDGIPVPSSTTIKARFQWELTPD